MFIIIYWQYEQRYVMCMEFILEGGCDIVMYIRIHARMRGARGHAVE